jgi:putative FmdB family regulatory protein
MPIYEYECTKCGQIKEAFQRFSDKPLSKCSHCSGKLQRLISHSSFHLKGSGWYVTDYANKSSPSSTKPKKSESKPAESAESASPVASTTAGSSDSAS